MSITHQTENAFMRIATAIEDDDLAALKTELASTSLTGSPHAFIEKAAELNRLAMLDYFHNLGWSFNHKVISNLLLDQTREKNSELVLNLLKNGATPSPTYLNSMAQIACNDGEYQVVAAALSLLSSIFSDPDRLIPKDERELAALILPGLSAPLKEGSVRDLIFQHLAKIDLSVETISNLFNTEEALRFIALTLESDQRSLGLSHHLKRLQT